MNEALTQSICGPPGSDRPATIALRTRGRTGADTPANLYPVLTESLRDSLTGLGNRQYFDLCLSQALGDFKPSDSLALLLIDLDRFDAVNDSFGRPIGDALLCLVAGRLRYVAGNTGIVGRLGGDEFAILLRNADVEALVAQSDDVVNRSFAINGHTVNIGVTTGIALANRQGVTATGLMHDAELALRNAKSAERQRWRFFEPSMGRRAEVRHRTAAEMRRALKMGEFKLDYQPQLNLRTGSLTGLEALLRWHHPTRGIIPPVTFIPQAEQVGTILSIGEWVLRTACLEAVGWPGEPRVAVNVSPLQFRDKNLLFIAVEGALSASGLAPDRLEIEITESCSLRRDDGVVAILHRLRELGVNIAMDDFGTGYSSLSQLRSFPFSRIKIDRSFVSTVADDERAAAVVGAIATLGASLGMTTTAEGVETIEQASIVQSNGCTDIQGYLISRPVPGDQVAGLLAVPQAVKLDQVQPECAG